MRADNGVRYLVRGHDHLHSRALVSTTDGESGHVQEIICAGASNKFYVGSIPSLDDIYNVPAFGHPRQTPMSYEANSIGFYIFTVDGLRVTVDYYSAPVESALYVSFLGSATFTSTPPLEFTRRETFGYALNGKRFIVRKGQSYAMIRDRFAHTSARVLGGINRSPATDGSDRPLVMDVSTGWTDGEPSTASDVFTLWGMLVGLGGRFTYPYTLSMTYRGPAPDSAPLLEGGFGLAAKDSSGNWVNAVELNSETTKDFVLGPWDPRYGDRLGTYGIDPSSLTAWAVVDHIGDFSVAAFADAPSTDRADAAP